MRNADCRLLVVSTVLTLAAGLVSGDALAQERLLRRPLRAFVAPPPPPSPMLAVVGLREQRITVYDSTGARMLESSVSSGADGYETPPGIFSVVQKEEEHHSNLYDDASMPFMQRLTWTGIALHAGALPGYPASHGCVRMPEDFAERLYGLTRIGMRVVVAREGIAPVRIAQPAIFLRNQETASDAGAAGVKPAGQAPVGESLAAHEARVRSLTHAAEEAASRARDARNVEDRAKAAVQPAQRALLQAETALAKAGAELLAAEKVLDGGPQKRLAEAERVKAAAPARIDAARVQLEKARDGAKARLEAVYDAEATVTAAQTAQSTAEQAVQQAMLTRAPVSVFVSRKTQRIYVRKAFHPLWEGPALIRDADKPIGTFVFTAMGASNATRELGWSVVSLYKNPTAIEAPAPRTKGSKRSAPVEMPVTDIAAAQAALDRLDIPAEIAEQLSEVVLPGSSLVLSDEPPHLETGKDTDFVVIMSGEPQGGITIRQAKPARTSAVDQDGDSSARRPRRSRGGDGGFSFGSWFD